VQRAFLFSCWKSPLAVYGRLPRTKYRILAQKSLKIFLTGCSFIVLDAKVLSAVARFQSSAAP
jgi:hypothetical protein